MFLLAILLIGLGLVVALLGTKLFRIILPIIGLVSGLVVGYVGVTEVFGTSVVSSTLAIVVAILVGVLLAILSFVFFDLAVLLYIALIGASIFTFLGVALGLNKEGFVVFMLALTGAILFGVWASNANMSFNLVVALTALTGVAYVLAGFFLIFGEIKLDQLYSNGVLASFVDVIDQSFLWLLVWIGSAVAAMQFQYRTLVEDFFKTGLEYEPKAVK